MWLIDEKARIFRREVAPNPPKAPKMADRAQVMASSSIGQFRYRRIINGAIFCHVIRIILVNQSRPLATSGNQKCTGAAPIFTMEATPIRMTAGCVIRLVSSVNI